MLNKKSFPVYCVVALFITIWSCKSERKHQIAEKPAEAVRLQFSRFENDLFAEGKNGATGLQRLRSKHGSFTDIILKQVAGLRGENDTLLAMEMNQYVSDKYITEVYGEVKKQYADIKFIEEGLTEAFTNYKAAFPGKLIPVIKTYSTPFNYNTIALDSTLGIGLDMYLGNTYKYYPTAGFPLYKIRKLRKEYIVSDALSAWIQSDYQPSQENNDLLNNMVHEGKILYAVNYLLPEIPDTIRYGYTAAQLKWCRENEVKLWQFFLAQKLLFSKNTSEYIKFINDGNITSGFPKEAPARLGVYIGLRIVEAFMEKHSKTTLPQLMNYTDAGQFLIESGYKPEK